MRKGHLSLVISRGKYCEKTSKSCGIRHYLKSMLISKEEKIFIIKAGLIKLYKDYEETTGIDDIPYFVRADIKLSQIIKDRKIDYYYNRLKRLGNN